MGTTPFTTSVGKHLSAEYDSIQPGPTTGGLVRWLPTLTLDTLGAAASDTILAAWRVPFDFYVEEICWYGVCTDVQLMLSHNTTLSLTGDTQIIDGDRNDIEPDGTTDPAGGQLADLYAATSQRYINHTNAKVPKGSYLIFHATSTASTGALDYLNMEVLGFPCSHIYTDPANDLP